MPTRFGHLLLTSCRGYWVVMAESLAAANEIDLRFDYNLTPVVTLLDSSLVISNPTS
jgi:hypothetical protein